MKKVDISIDLDDRLRGIVVQAITPELKTMGPRTQCKLSETDNGIILSFTANDTSALRAVINSHLRWINCIISTAETFEPGNY